MVNVVFQVAVTVGIVFMYLYMAKRWHQTPWNGSLDMIYSEYMKLFCYLMHWSYKRWKFQDNASCERANWVSDWLTTSFTHPPACRQTTQSVIQQPFSHSLHHPRVRMSVTGRVRVINWMIDWVNEWSINRVSVSECVCERVRACVRARANEWASESDSQWYLISVSRGSHYLSSEN